MKKNAVDKQIEEALKTSTGVFVFAVRSITTFLEEADKGSPDPDSAESLKNLNDSLGKMSEIIDRGEAAIKGLRDEDFMMDLFDALPEENQDHVMYALETFVQSLGTSMESSRGKTLEKQMYLLKQVASVMQHIDYCYMDLEYGEARWEAFDKVIKLENDYLAEEKDQEGKETGHRTALLDGIRDKFGAADRTKDFEETICRIYEGLDEESKGFFYWDILWYGIEDLKDEFDEVQDEYAGIEMDFSAYTNRIAALCQLSRTIRKKYGPPAVIEDEDPAES